MNLFYKPKSLICPHCEKSLGVEHDDAACRRRLSRRHFFGLALGALAAAKAAQATPLLEKVTAIPEVEGKITTSVLANEWSIYVVNTSFSVPYTNSSSRYISFDSNPHARAWMWSAPHGGWIQVENGGTISTGQVIYSYYQP